MKGFEIVFIPLTVGIIAQTTKFIIFSVKNGIKWNYFLTHGHMPSFHSAVAASLATTIGFFEGIDTGVFAISVVFALVIVDDALRVRMYLGDQGRYLNMLIQTLNLDQNKYPRLKEHVGHRISEVAVGVIYGFLLTILLLFVIGLFSN
ncbi:MAG: divergent PAP2 family protein [Patescibacteria group bacterium]|nr:divergent PAP2 family protein [Patescibacteria group bacterium]